MKKTENAKLVLQIIRFGMVHVKIVLTIQMEQDL